ncbi:TVP38/TMEM64 family protein [Paenibacillus physcomitrellae]|uniref:TVP38/TMEM64 family membrane protein n=1 Tax=Paenibacillus physcomitrellae TaxID=1619311 RepID=A0ABQ1GQT7_9BACL|nr:VTT domain-containing protein [Paenibacillus physcomitrellae]GGA47848.1 TVP38/TMEM64 family protein [Paenibacillus physcomitrellae]
MDNKSNCKTCRTGVKWISAFSLLLILAAIVYVAYLIKTGQYSKVMNSVQQLGILGIVAGIFIQAVLNMLPVPGEFSALLLLEVYGPVWGGVYAWIGGIVGSIGGLYLTRWVAKPHVAAVKPALDKMEEWLGRYGDLGLLMIRFVPFVPYHVVNYAAGLLKVGLWGFAWTTAVGILPYSIAMSCLYAGMRSSPWVWALVLGIGIAAAAWLFFFRRKNVVLDRK